MLCKKRALQPRIGRMMLYKAVTWLMLYGYKVIYIFIGRMWL